MEAAISYSEKDSPSVLWECTLCHSNSSHSLFDDENPIYHHQSDFKDHYDRTCHICLSEFTSKISKDQHQLSHSDGISKTCKSLCSLCGKKFLNYAKPIEIIKRFYDSTSQETNLGMKKLMNVS